MKIVSAHVAGYWRLAAIVVMSSIILFGMLRYVPDKASDIKICESETLRFYSVGSGERFMKECMLAKGYEFDVMPEDCESGTRMVMQPACYTPNAFGAKVLDRLRRPSKDR